MSTRFNLVCRTCDITIESSDLIRVRSMLAVCRLRREIARLAPLVKDDVLSLRWEYSTEWVPVKEIAEHAEHDMRVVNADCGELVEDDVTRLTELERA